MSTKSATPVMLVHDEGEPKLIRKFARKARRAGTAGSAIGTGSLRRPARMLIDDPVSRVSKQSYFIQAADLAAYAAFRHVYPPPARPTLVVRDRTWDELRTARLLEVNGLKGRRDGVVVYPRT